MFEKNYIVIICSVFLCLFHSLDGRIINSLDCMRDKGCCDGAMVNSNNINSFTNCTTIFGHIVIAPGSFKNLHPDKLEVFQNLKQIFGILEIRAKHRDFKSLQYFRQLELIICSDQYSHPLLIEETSLESLELDSLTRIESRLGVCIRDNKDLCNVESVNWSIFREYENFPNKIYNNGGQCVNKQFLCHDQCTEDGCWGKRPDQCLRCKSQQIGKTCEELKMYTRSIPRKCPKNHYVDNNNCTSCDGVCRNGCSGPSNKLGANGCNSCDKGLVVEDEDVIECLAFEDSCPNGYTDQIITLHIGLKGKILCRKIYSSDANKRVDKESSLKSIVVIILILVVVVVIAILYITLRVHFDWCKKSQKRIRSYNQVVTLIDEPMDIFEVTPNASRIIMIKETDIYNMKLLGRGSFGVVYEGIWKPTGTGDEISVAIKILHGDNSSQSTNDFLVEALIMATLDHPNVLNLMAMCVTSDIKLLTQLMPLGCLLYYVRNNKEGISPKMLITWSTQIAKGMAYLEGRNLVHRDLAARNIVLEATDCVKITDFGLSKFVGANISKEANNKTKLPIKWLALECLDGDEFTHKSDVWSFGITIWELLTFGQRPFEHVRVRDLPNLLRHGEKLPQPLVCSTDLYVLLIKCWILNPELRPDFRELEDVLERMSLAPSRYVACFGDTHFRLSNSNRTVINMRSSRKVTVDEESFQSTVGMHSYLQVVEKYIICDDGYLISTTQEEIDDVGYDVITNQFIAAK